MNKEKSSDVLYYTKPGNTPWMVADQSAYRAEVEKRFRENTPPKDNDIYRIDWRDRVARSEMRNWASEHLSKQAPETEEDFVIDQADWYSKMAQRVMKEQDPEGYEIAKQRKEFTHTPLDREKIAELRKRRATPVGVEMSKTYTGPERRQDPAFRKRVGDMTPEEMKTVLLRSYLVDLPNRRAFDEDQLDNPAPAVARSDADALKAFNDKFGYEYGDTLLHAKADALKEVGLNAYHEKGDEFLFRGMRSAEDLKTKLEKAREILRDTIFDVTLDDGTKLKLKGVDFSYGTGKNLDEAEAGQHAHKEAREKAGERRRGELWQELLKLEPGKIKEDPQARANHGTMAAIREMPNEQDRTGHVQRRRRGRSAATLVQVQYMAMQKA